MKTLADVVTTNQRFSRSVNVDRDHGPESIEGYLPTGRAIDVIRRFARGFADPRLGRAFSVTGPHGGGKSSLAVFLDALLAKRRGADHQAAINLLTDADPDISAIFRAGLTSLDPRGQGFLRLFVTAHREPVTTTLARGLVAAAEREFGARQKKTPPTFKSRPDLVTPQEILEAVHRISQTKPIVILIDEFGKNLEAFAEGLSEGDPYLLQALAEMGQGAHAAPVLIATLQHLSFDEYVQGVATSRRKEWAKVQGRFQDIPYVETGQQARRLISACIYRAPSAIDSMIDRWFDDNHVALLELGLSDLIHDSKSAYPLHPVALAVLPDLCARYGQNERTLFSFLGGPEPLAMPELLRSLPADQLTFIDLSHIYDYFLDSASTAIGAAATASRWLEIEGRIRDAIGLSAEQTTTLKTVGVLNLVSSGGSLRASQSQLRLLLGDDTDQVLESLSERGLITYRTFSDEWRVWQGSDYDIQGSIDLARRECAARPLDSLLNEALSLNPSVASRHSQETGILRLFGQTFGDLTRGSLPEIPDEVDGLVVYNTGSEVAAGLTTSKPIVACTPEDPGAIREYALEVAALKLALERARDADRVAFSELKERYAVATHALADTVRSVWSSKAGWALAGGPELSGMAGLSSVLSEAADSAYFKTPPLPNEMIARRELTSQGAKARRMLIDAMLVSPDKDAFGIEGYGADRAMYEAVFRFTGIHRVSKGAWKVGRPTNAHWRAAWDEVVEALRSATQSRLPLTDLYALLEAPPYGLKQGVIPVLLCAVLVSHAEETALYEHGSLVLHIDDAVAERLAKNPSHFTVKNPAVSSPVRQRVVDALCRDLKIQSPSGQPTFLEAATAVFRLLKQMPQYAHQTRLGLSPEAVRIRQAFRMAAEPDALFFESLPEILIGRTIASRARISDDDIYTYTSGLAAALREIKASYPRLLESVQSQLRDALGARSDSLADLHVESIGLAKQLDGRVLEPRLRAFAGALGRGQDSPQAWLENVAMVVAEGYSPRVWSDEIAQRFSLQIEELGGSFRRTMALLFERIAESDSGFDVRRITVTMPDGSERSAIVSVTETERDAASEALDTLIESLVEVLGSEDRACQTAMALLASRREDQAGEPTEEVDLRDSAHLRNQRG